MRTSASAPRLILAAVLLTLLAACGGETKSQPTQLDAPRYITSSPAATTTPWPTPWPTGTPRPTRAPLPTVTAYPTLDRSGGTSAPIDDAVPPGDWLNAPFTDDQGETRTLSEFLGRGVILQTLTAACEGCTDQQEQILQAIRDRYDQNLLPDTVFIALSIATTDSPERVKAALQRKLGDDWATVELVNSDATPAEYIFGVASPELNAALERYFGPDALNPDALTLIAFERDGYAHQMYYGVVDWHDIRSAISAYGNPAP